MVQEILRLPVEVDRLPCLAELVASSCKASTPGGLDSFQSCSYLKPTMPLPRIPDFHEEMDRFQRHVPSWVASSLNRLRRKRAKWVRVPAGVALVGGGVLGFLPLPLVGIWMLPVGLALLAHDIPRMRRPMARVPHFTNGKIEKRKF